MVLDDFEAAESSQSSTEADWNHTVCLDVYLKNQYKLGARVGSTSLFKFKNVQFILIFVRQPCKY